MLEIISCDLYRRKFRRDLRQAPGNFIFGRLNRPVGIQLAQARRTILKLKTKWRYELNREISAPGPDISRIALLCTVVPARIVPSYSAAAITVMPGQPMSPAVADVLNRSQNAGEYLAAAGYFISRLDDVANTGDARLFARHSHGQRRIGDPRIFEYEMRSARLRRPREFARVFETTAPCESVLPEILRVRVSLSSLHTI